MGRKRMILLMAAAVLMMIAMTASAVFAGSKEPDLTDVTGIRYELASPVELEQWVDGILDDDSGAFYYEYVKDKIYKDGSTLILVKSDGSESRYVLDNNKKAFIGEDGTSIKRNALYISEDHDYNAEWKIGRKTFNGWELGDHDVTIKYGEFACDVTVSVIENSIDKIEYIRHDPLVKNQGGYWSTDAAENKYYFYNCNFGAQDLLRVTMKGGAIKEYIHKDGDEEEDDDLGSQYIFRAIDGTSIGLWYYQITDDQPDHHWTLGSENYVTVYYGGKDCISPVTIKLKNTMNASGKSVKVKYSRLKKKTQKIPQKKAFSVSKAKGTVTYKLVKKDKKAKNKITVSKKGVVTVKKGLKKGKYTIYVNVTAAGNSLYAPMTKKVRVKISVR